MSIQESQTPYPEVIRHLVSSNPKNKRRRRNKIVFENDSFELIYDQHVSQFDLKKKKDLYFSIIPYDTSRKYMHQAAHLALMYPELLETYIKEHESNIKTYMALSLFQVTGERYTLDSEEVTREFNRTTSDDLFKIQVVGRLLQHDETGPLSASLPYKFLYDLNVRTGTHGYIQELVSFYHTIESYLPFQVERGGVRLVERPAITTVQEGLSSVSNEVSIRVSQLRENGSRTLRHSLLSAEQRHELEQIRHNYVAHSQHPKPLDAYFEKPERERQIHPINVVSDIHSTSSEIDLVSPTFNIIAGDLSESFATHSALKGIAVIGNHDILECALAIPDLLHPEDQAALLNVTDTDFSVLKIDDGILYERCKLALERRFPQLVFLNNQVYHHDGVRYIGLSIPVCYVRARKQAQAYLVKILGELLGKDRTTPTVIVSHAPLFNELSRLSPKSNSYQRDFHCVNEGFNRLMADYHIIGFIHGHHHIPASTGVVDERRFMGKKVFVMCSIYSQLNHGVDLTPFLDATSTTKNLSL